MLQIRLSTVPSSEGGTAPKSGPTDSVTVACPDHLVLADLPVAKGLGSTTGSALVRNAGRRSRRPLGERVHCCINCDLPIAIYGRLSPCEHVFCLDCSRSDSICYICDERIQKIQTIKLMEGIYVCAAPRCFKSFLKKSEFEIHLFKTHIDLLNPDVARSIGRQLEAIGAKQSTASESTTRALPPKTPFSPNSTSQVNDNDDKSHVIQLKDQQQQQQQSPRPYMQPMLYPTPYFGQFQNSPSEAQPMPFPPPYFGQFQMEGAQPSDQGTIMGFSQQWNMIQGFPNMLDPQGRGVFLEGGNYRPNMSIVPVNMPNPSTTTGMDIDTKGMLAPQPLPPLPPQQFSQPKQEE